MKHLLSKSTFMYGYQCPKRLYLHKFHPDLKDPLDEERIAIFQQGTDIGLLAQQLFPDGVNAQGDEEWHSYKTVDITSKLLPVHYVIYEAAFMHEEVLCAVDILVRKAGKYYAYEVKGTNSVKEQHITDATLQYHVIHNSGIDLADFSIIHFNNQYTRIGPVDVQQLFTATSVLDQIVEQQPYIQPKINELKEILSNSMPPDVETGKHCLRPYPCDFIGHCHKDRVITEPESDPDPRILVHHEPLLEFIRSVQYPVYFLDFETVMYGVPEYENSTPYQQIPFQYSLHLQESPGSPLKHFSYLGDGLSDPRESLIIQMLAGIGTKGSVMVWNEMFERGCIQRLANQFPKYREPLLAIINRMTDLMVPFRKKHLYSESFYSSYSIKNILPVLVPELSYLNLAIREGATASATYGLLRNMSEPDQKLIRQQLLDYCELDTLAMVRIWEKVVESVR